jgi:hypothetical protein
LVQYYSSLLIKQYAGKPKAIATVEALASIAVQPVVTTQVLSFDSIPVTGFFVVTYNGVSAAPIYYNFSASAVQISLRAIPALSSVIVTGSFAAGFTVTFDGVAAPAMMLVLLSNNMGVGVSIIETDVTLPIVIQDAFSLTLR